MDSIKEKYLYIKNKYDHGENSLNDIITFSIFCLNKLLTEANTQFHGINGSNKEYNIFYSGNSFSRPYLPNLFINNPDELRSLWNQLLENIDTHNRKINITSTLINKIIYTTSMSFAMCFDVWKPKSRKTPGTFYEIIIGSIISELLPDYTRTKHIPLPMMVNDEDEISDEEEASVSTDIVFTKNDVGLVLPVKITTRERIVQPFAHQRILDSVFGINKYKSILICISETKLDIDNKKVDDICVPGTIKLFQQHLAHLSGIFYLDPPQRYLNSDITDIIKIATVGDLLSHDLSTYLE